MNSDSLVRAAVAFEPSPSGLNVRSLLSVPIVYEGRAVAVINARALGADVVTVYQYDQGRDEFLVEGTGPTIAGELRDPAPMRTKVYSNDVPFHIVRSRQSAFHQDVDSQEFLRRHIDRPSAPRPRFVDREGIKSMAALLLPFSVGSTRNATDEEIVGVMFANYRSHHAFNIDERKALATFADFAAADIRRSVIDLHLAFSEHGAPSATNSTPLQQDEVKAPRYSPRTGSLSCTPSTHPSPTTSTK